MAEQFELGLLALLAAQLGGGALADESLYIECPCGVKLDRVAPRRAYGIATSIRCDGCRQNIGALEPCYHCPRGRTLVHTSGYDLCDSCAEKKAEEQTKKDEQNAPRMADPLKFVRCRCGNQMDFIPVRLKYRAPCKCDECGDTVPRLSYIYHCPKDRMDDHRTAHRLFDYCFACAYKKNPALAHGPDDPNKLPLAISSTLKSDATSGDNKKLDEKEDTKETENNKISDTSDLVVGNTILEDVAQFDLLKRRLQKRIIQIQKLEEELKTLRGTDEQTSKNTTTETSTDKLRNDSQDTKGQGNQNKSADLSVLDAILQSELSRLVLVGGSNNVGNNVNKIAEELVKLGLRQREALQWLSAGEISANKTTNTNNNTNNEEKVAERIWNQVSLQSLQTTYEHLNVLIKQYQEMISQVASLKTTCLQYISKKQDDWENWNANEVVDWISAVENGRFLKYDLHLREVMNQRSFKGKHMKTIKSDRLAAFGIKDNDDVNALMSCIQILVKGKS